MSNSNVIAWLYPADGSNQGFASTMVQLPWNKLAQIHPVIEEDHGDRSRETTASGEGGDDIFLASQGLRLDLNNGPNNREGFVFGTDPSCDFVFPKSKALKTIGKRQCVITFDDQDRLILQDLRQRGKGEGTSVKYDRLSEGKRREFQWLLSTAEHHDDHPVNHKGIEITFHKKLVFTICVERNSLTRENIARFRYNLFTMTGLALQSLPPSEPGTGAITPSQDPIFHREKTIGRGTFGSVALVWDVSTGQNYARKKPHSEFRRQSWLQEIAMMRKVDHPNIVSLFYAEEGEVPALYLEYLHLGNLDVQHETATFSTREVWKILQQGLTGLEHLHGKHIMHRDIKPENILVAERARQYDVLQVKLADFGLSKEGSALNSACGTVTYCAPEIAKHFMRGPTDTKYKSSVDIWSLGAVAFRFAWGLPQHGDEQGLSWCQKIIDEAYFAQEYESWGLIAFLVGHLLVMDPNMRSSAATCLHNLANCEPQQVSTLAREDKPSASNGQNRRDQTVRPQAGSRHLESSVAGPSSASAAAILQALQDYRE